MLSDKEQIFQLPNYCPFLSYEAKSAPYELQSVCEHKHAKRRICHSVKGIRAVFFDPISPTRQTALANCHHLISAKEDEAYEECSYSVIREQYACDGIGVGVGHPEIAFGLSDPDQWSILISVNANMSSNGICYFTDWQAQMCVDLVLQTWCRYPNLLWIANASHFNPAHQSSFLDQHFPWRSIINTVESAIESAGIE